MKRKLSPRALFAVVIGGVLVYALAFWFVAVGPKRAEASALKDEVAALQVTVAAARLAAMPQKNDDTQPIAVADIFRLAKAMPSGPDMPGILLELSRIAEETGIEFQSVTPAASEVVSGFQKVPISLAFDGNFYELSDFLFRLRTLVGVRRASSVRPAGCLRSSRSRSPSRRRDSRSSAPRSRSSRTSTGRTPRPARAHRPRPHTAGRSECGGTCGRPKCGDAGTCAGRHTDRSGGESLMAKRVDPLAAKKAKQKKLAIVLCVLLVGVVAFQGPKMLKMMKGPQATPAAAPAAPVAAPTGGTAAPDPARLRPRPCRRRRPYSPTPTSRRARRAASWSRSRASRPRIRSPSSSPSPRRMTTAAPAAEDRAAAPRRPRTPRAPRARPRAPSTRSARTRRIRIRTRAREHDAAGRAARHRDGDHDLDQRIDRERRRTKASFPAADPVFVLESLAADGKSAEISVAGGSYADGKQTIKLQIGKKLTLQNTSDGSRYDLELLTVAGFVPPKK